MKYAAAILIVFVLYACGSDSSMPDSNTIEANTTPVHDLHPEIGKKKIKSVSATTLLSKRFSPDRFEFERRVIQNFDSTGQLTDEKEFVTDSTVLFRHRYQQYRGDTLFEIDKNIVSVKKPEMKTKISKFLDGRIVEEVSTHSYPPIVGGDVEYTDVPVTSRMFYKYDKQNRLEATIQKYADREYRCQLKYNSNNQIIAKSCKSSKPSAYPYSERYYYNSDGLKIKQTETSYNANEIMFEYKRYYQYNPDDSLVFESRYRNGVNFLIENTEFNDKGQKTAGFIYDGRRGLPATLSLKHYYYYDWNGNLKMHVLLGNNGDPVRTILFAYDDEDNLIQKREYSHSIDKDKRAVMSRLVTRYRYDFY